MTKMQMGILLNANPYKIICLLIIYLTYNSNAFAFDIAGKYQVIGNKDDIVKTEMVELIEFFNFSCGHCYHFLTTYKTLEKKFGNRLEHKEIPIFWGNQTPMPAMAYLIAGEHDKADAIKREIFNANFKMGIDVFDKRNVGFIASSIGIGEYFEQGIMSERIKNLVSKNQEMANSYGATETPTIILNRIIKVTPSMTEGDVDKMTDNIALIISGLLK